MLTNFLINALIAVDEHSPPEIVETWLEKKIISLDKYDGEIEKISRRLSYIRTWNYVANRGSWLENPSFLQKGVKSIEEKLWHGQLGIIIFHWH